MTLEEIRKELKRLHSRQDKSYKVLELRRKQIDRLKKEQERIERERAAAEVNITKCKPGASGIKKPTGSKNGEPTINGLLARLSDAEKQAMLELLKKG